MRFTLRQLQVFLAVFRSGSTTAAALSVSLSQSATSAALNELEGVFGTNLFDRVGKKLVLNDSGRALLPLARQMFDTGSTIEQQFSNSNAKTQYSLHIGASTTIGNYLLPIILQAYVAKGNDVLPNVFIANTADVVRAVASYEVDFGLIEGPCHEPNVTIEPWFQDELIVVCAPSHSLLADRKSQKVSLADLRNARWLLREAGSGTRETVESALLPYLTQLNYAGEFSTAEAIKQGASVGLGIACMSRHVVKDFLASGQLVEVNSVLPKLHRHFYIIYNRNKILSNQLSSFLETCRSWTE